MNNVPMNEDPQVPESFVDQVKEALENVYDFPALQKHALSLAIGAQHPNAKDPPAQQLRRELIEAIEKLNPSSKIAVRSGAARLYHLMHLHYVGGMTLQEASSELGISPRQAYRDLRRGQESVSAMLWYKYGAMFTQVIQNPHTPPSAPPVSVAPPPATDDLTPVQTEYDWVEMSDLLVASAQAVQRLAEQRQVRLVLHRAESALVSTNSTLARQIFMNLLSRSVQHAEAGELHVELEAFPAHAQLTIRFQTPQAQTVSAPVIEQFIQQLGWQMGTEHIGRQQVVTLKTWGAKRTLLLIDDNKGLVDLLKHYLEGDLFFVLTANSGEEGLRIAQEIPPDVIVMDLMMPGMDGWELLQRFRNQKHTRETPVVICSVINDPELAYSLGASKFVTKPVTQESLLDALRDLL